MVSIFSCAALCDLNVNSTTIHRRCSLVFSMLYFLFFISESIYFKFNSVIDYFTCRNSDWQFEPLFLTFNLNSLSHIMLLIQIQVVRRPDSLGMIAVVTLVT